MNISIEEERLLKKIVQKKKLEAFMKKRCIRLCMDIRLRWADRSSLHSWEGSFTDIIILSIKKLQEAIDDKPALWSLSGG